MRIHLFKWSEGKTEAGQVAPLLLLLFTLVLQVTCGLASRQVLGAWQQAYQALNGRDQELSTAMPASFQAWGSSYPQLAPRIDYGSFTQREREAEALCFYLISVPYAAAGEQWSCD